jgi:proliferating cell nuclear antigen PCNA
MNITLKTPEKVLKFTEIFKNLKNLIDEINMVVTEEKLYMQGMDSTHALLFELEMKKQWFDEYNVIEKDTFGIHCETFFKIINCSNNGQYISMKATPQDDNITIMFEGENQISKIFELSRIELDDNDLEIPDVEYEADIGFDSNVFSELIKETAIFNDTINFKCNEETIQMIAQGTLGKMTASVKEDDIIYLGLEEDCNLDIYYTLGFLDKICGFSKLNNEIQIHCSEQYPMKIQYNLDDTTIDSETEAESYCRFFIAPKIQDD